MTIGPEKTLDEEKILVAGEPCLLVSASFSAKVLVWDVNRGRARWTAKHLP